MSDGKIGGHWLWGTSAYTAVLIVALGKAALIVTIWNKWTVLAIPGSLVIWLAFIPFYGWLSPRLGGGLATDNELVGIVPKMFSSPVFYALCLILTPACLVRDFAWKYGKRMYLAQDYHVVQEISKYNVADYRPRMEQVSYGWSARAAIMLTCNSSRRRFARSAWCNDNENREGTFHHLIGTFGHLLTLLQLCLFC